MKKTIKIAAVNSEFNKLPAEANPYSDKFQADAPARYVESNIEKMAGFLHEAGRNNVDLVCTYEGFKGAGTYLRYMENKNIFLSFVEEIPGPTSDRFAKIAKQYNMLIAANYYEKEGGKVYNSTVLIGRKGEIIGVYRKVHLPVSEKWLVTPGTEIPVFETDIGRIGIAVCYDIAFTEHCRILALNGADIILHPTGGTGVNAVSTNELGEALIRVRAAENAVYLVVAKITAHGGKLKSCIINNAGEFIGKTMLEEEGLAIAEFTPDFDIDRPNLFDTLFSGVSSVKARHFLERMPESYSALVAGKPPVLDRYKGVNLDLSPEHEAEVFDVWKKYVTRSAEVKYTW